MKRSGSLVWLSWIVVALAVVAAGAGLFWQETGSSFAFTTLRGQTAQIYGQGLYRYDTVFNAAGNRGTDLVTLFLGVPVLVASILLYLRGSLRGGLMLAASLAYFLYVYATLSVNAAYNDLFLVYVALLSASFFGLVRALTLIDVGGLVARLSPESPRRGLMIFMFASGVLTAIVWLSPIVGGMMQGTVPEKMDSYTTTVTFALDLAIIVPSAFLAGYLLLKRAATGYLVALPLMGIIILLGPAVAAGTWFQLAAGIEFTPGQAIGPVAGFGVVGLVSIWLMWLFLRSVQQEQGEMAINNDSSSDTNAGKQPAYR